MLFKVAIVSFVLALVMLIETRHFDVFDENLDSVKELITEWDKK
jgi:hypothetical protein